MNRLLLVVVAVVPAATGCVVGAQQGADESSEPSQGVAQSELGRSGLGADGDSCTVRTKPNGDKVPGTEKDGECCSNTDSTDCTIILKNPFPKAFTSKF